MMKLYDSLKIKYASCPPDCSACEEVCARERGAGADGRIKSIHVPEIGFNSAMTCIQCAVPQCLEVCPTAAIAKDSETGAVRFWKLRGASRMHSDSRAQVSILLQAR